MTALSQSLVVLLCSLVEDRAGLHYSESERAVFAKKVSARMQDAGFESLLDYYYFLRYDPAGDEELNLLVDALVISETYLFREVSALVAAIATVLRPAIEARGRARVWSAGCASGEEPFTLAMLCAEEGILDRVEIVATDVSTRALDRARAGRLGIRSCRVLTSDVPGMAAPWIASVAERWVTDNRMDPEIVRAIDFRRESLVGVDPPADRRELDFILCRNVLIYFRDEVVRNVVQMLTDHLRSGGRLAVGVSESLLRFGTALECEERGGAFFYLKSNAAR